MRGSRIVSGLFLAALLALFVWAVLTGVFKDFLTDSARFFGIENPVVSTGSDGEDVLFDDDSTVDWSDPYTDTFDPSPSFPEVPSGSSDVSKGKFYEFALTPEYFNALLEKYSGASALKNVTATFSEGQVVLSGDVNVLALTKQMNIPAALVIFLPDTVPCTLCCVPEVVDGCLQVTVPKVSAGNDVLAPFLSQPGVLSTVEDFLNEQLTKYLSDDYVMQSARVTKSGMYVRFSVE